MSGRTEFVFIVEGKTEKESLRLFFARCLAIFGVTGVGIQIRTLSAASRVFKEGPGFAKALLNSPSGSKIIAVYTLLDLYNPGIFPSVGMSIEERWQWGKADMQGRFQHERYKHFFAVHETEAWLLSDMEKLPRELQQELKKFGVSPETVNDQNPPAKRISDAYLKQFNRRYIKPEQGRQYFKNVRPENALSKCPYLKLLVEDMVSMATGEGLLEP